MRLWTVRMRELRNMASMVYSKSWKLGYISTKKACWCYLLPLHRFKSNKKCIFSLGWLENGQTNSLRCTLITFHWLFRMSVLLCIYIYIYMCMCVSLHLHGPQFVCYSWRVSNAIPRYSIYTHPYDQPPRVHGFYLCALISGTNDSESLCRDGTKMSHLVGHSSVNQKS